MTRMKPPQRFGSCSPRAAFLTGLLCCACLGAAFRVINNLQDLVNVHVASAPSNGDALVYNTTLAGWTNGTAGVPTSGGSATNLTVYQSLDFDTNKIVITNASGTTTVRMASDVRLFWTDAGALGGLADLGISRNAAGVLEVNSGVGGDFKDAKLRNLTLTGPLTSSNNIFGSTTTATFPVTLVANADGYYNYKLTYPGSSVTGDAFVGSAYSGLVVLGSATPHQIGLAVNNGWPDLCLKADSTVAVALNAAEKTTAARLHVFTDGATKVGLMIDAKAAQTADLVTLRDSGAATLFSISSNGVVYATNLIVGAGAQLKGVLSATASLNFGNVASLASADLTITVTGAAVNDSVELGPPAAPDAAFSFMGFVSAADTVTVRAFNVTAGAVDPAAATFRATVIKF